MNLSEALALAQNDSAFMRLKHETCLEWVACSPAISELAWLPKGWASGRITNDELRMTNPDTRPPTRAEPGAANRLISARGIRRIRRMGSEGRNGLNARAMHVLDERCAMQVAVRSVLARSAPFPHACPASDIFVRYSPLGQPLVGWRGDAAEWGRTNGIQQRDLHISFTHDGEAVLALAAHSKKLRGVGIDIVRLDRLRNKSRDYLHRFSSHFMSEPEYEHFATESAEESVEDTLLRVAAHFSLMESASKALGTGLKIGGGMGKAESLPKRSINVRVSGGGGRGSGAGKSQPPEVEFDLAPDAEDRIRHLNAARLEGYFSVDSEYLVSAAYLQV